jgi:hypothetical protein
MAHDCHAAELAFSEQNDPGALWQQSEHIRQQRQLHPSGAVTATVRHAGLRPGHRPAPKGQTHDQQLMSEAHLGAIHNQAYFTERGRGLVRPPTGHRLIPFPHVHGGIGQKAFQATPKTRALPMTKGAGLIWCPSSNIYMLGRTTEVRELAAQERVALGSDSRLSGGCDLLEELRVASEVAGMDGAALLPLVTAHAARMLRLAEVGTRQHGAVADLLVLPACRKLFELAAPVSAVPGLQGAAVPVPAASGMGLSVNVSRVAVRMVMRAARALYADPYYALAFAAGGTRAACIQVDGHGKLLEQTMALRLRPCSIQEPGVGMLPFHHSAYV